jgi:hypothetical protein
MTGKLTIFVIMVFVAAAFATPVVVQPGPEGKDTYIKINDTTLSSSTYRLTRE